MRSYAPMLMLMLMVCLSSPLVGAGGSDILIADFEAKTTATGR